METVFAIRKRETFGPCGDNLTRCPSWAIGTEMAARRLAYSRRGSGCAMQMATGNGMMSLAATYYSCGVNPATFLSLAIGTETGGPKSVSLETAPGSSTEMAIEHWTQATAFTF